MTIQLDNVFGLVLIFVRTETLIIAVPTLGGTSIPVQIRVGLGMMISAILLTVVPVAPLTGIGTAGLVEAMLYEFLIGLGMGMAVHGVMSCISFAADTIVNEVGLLRVETFNPADNTSSGGSISTMLYFFSLMVFLGLGMHRQVILALAQSFYALPAGCMNVSGLSLDALLYITKQIFIVGILMSAPFIAINFLVNIVFSLLGKISPKMNVFVISMPVRILAGTAVLLSTITLLAHYMEAEFTAVPARMLEVVLGH
jgi:flagellar biosynthesis protein FliR